eukprot:scaffold6050_cov57-Attheya_sp.AAC.2
MMKVGSVNAVKLVMLQWKYRTRWMAEFISQQQSSFGIGDMDGDDQEWSCHGRLREGIHQGWVQSRNEMSARFAALQVKVSALESSIYANIQYLCILSPSPCFNPVTGLKSSHTTGLQISTLNVYVTG